MALHSFLNITLLLAMTVGQQPVTADWRTGDRLNKALQNTVRISWADSPLRESLMRFSQRQGIAVMLDRRIDPSQTVQIDLPRLSNEETIYRIADKINGGVCRLGDVFYIGPRKDVANLILYRDQLIRQIAMLPEETRERLLERQPLKWDELTQPNDVLNEVLATAGVTVHWQSIPHDLWPAYDFPAMPLVDRAMLICFGFGVGVDIKTSAQGETAVELSSYQMKPAGRYAFGNSMPPDELRKAKKDFGECQFENHPEGLTVQGPPLQIYEIGRLLAALNQRESQQGDGEVVVSLNTTASIGSILTKIANNLELELQYEPAIVETLRKRVEIQVEKSTYDTLLRKTLESTDLEFEITADALIIRDKDSP